MNKSSHGEGVKEKEASYFLSVFGYKGRLRRRDYALRLLLGVVILFSSYGYLLWRVVELGLGEEEIAARMLSVMSLFYLVVLATIFFICTQTAKRLHDIGYSGWYCLVPYIQLSLLFIEGECGANRYGAAPKKRLPGPSDENLSNDPDRMFVRPFSFRGRIRRKEYVASMLVQLLGIAALFLVCYLQIDAVIEHDADKTPAIVTCVASGLLLFLIVWFGLAQKAKRLHDVGLSGWFCLSPVFGFALLFVPGVNETNRWGSRPKREENRVPRLWEVEPAGANPFRMFRNPFGFRGRIRRTEYAISMIMAILLLYICILFISFVGVGVFQLSDMEDGQQVKWIFLMCLPMLVFLWFYLAQTAKRLHDADIPGLYCLASGIWLALVFVEGTNGENRYGASPKPVAISTLKPEVPVEEMKDSSEGGE